MAVAPDHAELSEQLNAYLDRALDDVTRRRLERHLAACAACRLDLEQLRATRDALRSLPQLEAPRSFAIALPAPRTLASPRRWASRRRGACCAGFVAPAGAFHRRGPALAGLDVAPGLPRRPACSWRW